MSRGERVRGTPLAELMELHQVRMVDLMALSGRGPAVIQQLRAGEYERVTVGVLVDIARVFGVAPSDFVPGLTSKQPSDGPVDSPDAVALRVRAKLARRACTKRFVRTAAERMQARVAEQTEQLVERDRGQ